MAPNCPSCGVEVVEGTDRMGYEMQQCPDCARWRRPDSDKWRMPKEGEYGE